MEKVPPQIDNHHRNWKDIFFDLVPLFVNYVQDEAKEEVKRQRVSLMKKTAVALLFFLGCIYLTVSLAHLISFYAGADWIGFGAVGILLIVSAWTISGWKNSKEK